MTVKLYGSIIFILRHTILKSVVIPYGHFSSVNSMPVCWNTTIWFCSLYDSVLYGHVLRPERL